jgi:flavorubredoxin
MGVTNAQSGTNVHEIADGIYRINTPVPPGPAMPRGFSFNQYLVVDDQPLLFHTGLRHLFPVVREAVAHVMPVERLRYVSFSHHEADESGSLNEWLAAAPAAVPLCGRMLAMLTISDVADRPPKVLADGESISLGKHTVRWLDTPHLPHGWEAGYLMETATRTLLCGDLFTQAGADCAPLVESDLLEPAEAMRASMDYYAHSPATGALIGKLAAENPTTLACMHGSAWRGDGRSLLAALAGRLRPHAAR